MNRGIVILVNDDVHAVFSVSEGVGNLDRIREGLRDIVKLNPDEVKSIRVQRCVIEPALSTDAIIETIRGNFL